MEAYGGSDTEPVLVVQGQMHGERWQGQRQSRGQPAAADDGLIHVPKGGANAGHATASEAPHWKSGAEACTATLLESTYGESSIDASTGPTEIDADIARLEGIRGNSVAMGC